MTELLRGKYELANGWTLDKLKWDVIYDIVKNGKAITKIIPLDENYYEQAKVGEPCVFYIEKIKNKEFAIIKNTEMKINNHLFDNINEQSNNIDPTPEKTSVYYSEEEMKDIILKVVNRTSPHFHENMKTKIADELYEDYRKKGVTFYRVCHEKTLRGLWYDFDGNFTGIIHNEFNFCKNNKLEMDFDPELVGWLSATDSLDKLFEWFPKEDILKLQTFGWYLHEFEAVDFKLYERFNHTVINQKTSKVVKKIIFD